MNEDNLVETPEALETDNPQNEQVDQSSSKDDEATTLRHAQQLEGSKKEVERMRELVIENAAKAASVDGESLLELHRKDPKLAKEVAARFTWEKTDYGTYQNFLEGKKQAAPVEDDFDKRYQEKRSQEVHLEALEEATTIIEKLPEDQQEEADAYFKKIVGDRKLDRKTAKEFAEMATLYVNRDKYKNEKQGDLADYANTGVSRSKKASKEDTVTVIKDGKVILVPNTYSN